MTSNVAPSIDLNTFYAFIGFFLAAYSVVGNDSVQTLGTFIASNIRIFKWQKLWLATSLVLICTIWLSWFLNNGDISFGRLDKIPVSPILWYHAFAPLALLILTRFGIPVSTTFLVLSTFASGVLLREMLVKSVLGYGIAALGSYALWLILSRFINERHNRVKKEHRTHWRILQWLGTCFLWVSWLTHDLANVAVFLPRQVPLTTLLGVNLVLIGWLAYIFKNQGGRIQKILLEKTGSRFMRSATIIDFVYAFLLIFFQQLNNIPMSTTWVFVGILCGRELAIANTTKDYTLRDVFPLIGKDFIKMLVGLLVSMAIVLGIHGL
ncbi:MAG TPA: hypothetical protein PKA63_12885 [Oligoflexia bacterium]|nr:hypothetical protein [Oligoflexia bacterium]HMP49554.1 hypothetical protein [Oligoflexia bacterium]